VPQALVSGGGEIVDPLEVEDPGSTLGGDAARAIGGTGIDDNDLVDQRSDGFQAQREILLLVAHDHTQ
jgi:hypothetical protein